MTLKDTHARTHARATELLWMRDRPISKTSTRGQTTCTRDKTSMPRAGFEPVISGSEWPQTHALDRTVSCIITMKTQVLFFAILLSQNTKFPTNRE